MANEKHLLLQIEGGYTSPALQAERWQCGLRLALWEPSWGTGSPDLVGTLSRSWAPVADNQTRAETNFSVESTWRIDGGFGSFFSPVDYLAEQVEPAVRSWFNNTIHGSTIQVEQMRLYPIGPDGKAVPAPPYSQGTPASLTYTQNRPKGTASGGMMPLQVAVAVSHRTPQTGRKGRGRMFLPGIAVSAVASDTSINSTTRGEITTRQRSLLEDLAYTGGNPLLGNWLVRACVIGAPWTQYAQITEVRCGSVPDTQRRRRNALEETYSVAQVDQ